MDHSDFFLVRKKKDLWPLDVVATRHLKEICMECDALEIACGISSHLVLRLLDARGIVNFLGIFFQGTGRLEDHYKGKLNSKFQAGIIPSLSFIMLFGVKILVMVKQQWHMLAASYCAAVGA